MDKRGNVHADGWVIFSEGWFVAFMNLGDLIFTVVNPYEVVTSGNAIVSVDLFKQFERSSQ